MQNHERRVAVDFDISRDGSGAVPSVQDTLLQDGDVVKVFGVASLDEKVVHLEGHTVRPGTYQWKPGVRLKDILNSYDILLPQPNTEYGEIIRLIPPDLHPVTIPFNLGQLLAGDAAQNIELAQYDTIRVFRWDERVSQKVTISGMVYDPNEYRLVPDMKVCDLIAVAAACRKTPTSARRRSRAGTSVRKAWPRRRSRSISKRRLSATLKITSPCATTTIW